MKLNELDTGANIILKVNIQEQSFEFASYIIDKNKNGVFAEPVRMDDKVISFGGESVHIDLMYIRKDKPPFVWKNVVCTTIQSSGTTKYQLTVNGEGYEMNRREAFRIFVGVNGVIQIGTNRKALDIIVKDVSETGFAVVAQDDMERFVNMPVRMVFTDMNRSFALMGLIVRKVVIAPNKILYGCRLGVQNSELSRYITEKQRQQMSVNKNNAAYKQKEELQKALQEDNAAAIAGDGKGMPTGMYMDPDGTHKRALDNVQKMERRQVFKDKQTGKRV